METADKPVIQNESELERNERIWRESKITNYRMTLNAGIADALYTNLRPVEIEVREGKAVSIRHLAKGGKLLSMEEAKSDYGLMLYQRRGVETIEGLFKLIKQTEEEKNLSGIPTILQVEYDSKFGYPTKLNIFPAATDSDLSLQVKNIEIIE